MGCETVSGDYRALQNILRDPQSEVVPLNEIQKQLLDYLKAQLHVYENSRTLYLAPADRASRVTFYRNSIEEIERLIALETPKRQNDWNGGD
jgi:hypothetical protein